MATSYVERLNAIDWDQYDTAYGRATKVPEQLVRLISSAHGIAVKASDELWGGLCHQHAYVSSAALPALPFILEALESADVELTVEILDILLGFVVCTNPRVVAGLPGWATELRQQLRMELHRFEQFSKHPNENVAYFAQRAVADLSENELH